MQSGKTLGYILDVTVDESLNKTGYIVVEEESENELFLSLSQIVCHKNNFVVVSDAAQLEMAFEKSSVFGKQLCSLDGLDLGQIKKVIFVKNKCGKVITQKCEICAKHILTVGADVVFVGKKRKNFAARNFPRFETDTKVSIQNAQNECAQSIFPQRVTLSSSFYLGKVCLCDIFGYNNEKIVSKNQIVTKSIFEKAKHHNKINQLFFALKKEN